jgi:hypothetical protein
MFDQLVPFQCSTNVFGPEPVVPTAKQLVVLGHATPERTPKLVGFVTTDHAVPFQCSTNVLFAEFTKEVPTAKQLVVLGHATPLSTAKFVLVGLGLTMTLQAVPFQCSTRVFPVELAE